MDNSESSSTQIEMIPTLNIVKTDLDILAEEVEMNQKCVKKVEKYFIKYRKFTEGKQMASGYEVENAVFDGVVKVIRKIGRLKDKKRVVKNKEFRRIFLSHFGVAELEGWTMFDEEYFYVYRYYDMKLEFYIQEKQITTEIFKNFGISLLGAVKALNYQDMHIASSLVFIYEDRPVIGYDLLDDKADYNPENPPKIPKNVSDFIQNGVTEELVHYLLIKLENTRVELKNLIEIFKKFENIREIEDQVRHTCKLLSYFLGSLNDKGRFVDDFIRNRRGKIGIYDEFKTFVERYQEDFELFFKQNRVSQY